MKTVDPRAPTLRPDLIEVMAQAIYETFLYGKETGGTKPPWVPGGNSKKQTEARIYAVAAWNSVPAGTYRAVFSMKQRLDVLNRLRSVLQYGRLLKAEWAASPDKLLQDAAEEIERLRSVLGECREYFDNRSDADHNGHSYVPNDEMRMMMEIDEVLPPEKEK